MDIDQTLKLFDSVWFETEIIFKNQTKHAHQFPEYSWRHRGTPSGTTKAGEDDDDEDDDDDDDGEHRGGESKERSRKMRLSELELEELKGFMDLGFVFPEEDRDPRLVSLIPALQRLSRRNLTDGGDDDEYRDSNRPEESEISGPYLSEAWEDKSSKRRKKKKKKEMMKKSPLMEWRFSGWNHQMNIKGNLRLWAYSVASTVR